MQKGSTLTQICKNRSHADSYFAEFTHSNVHKSKRGVNHVSANPLYAAFRLLCNQAKMGRQRPGSGVWFRLLFPTNPTTLLLPHQSHLPPPPNRHVNSTTTNMCDYKPSRLARLAASETHAVASQPARSPLRERSSFASLISQAFILEPLSPCDLDMSHR